MGDGRWGMVDGGWGDDFLGMRREGGEGRLGELIYLHCLCGCRD